MSMKSMTSAHNVTNAQLPGNFLGASRLVLVAVVSISLPRVARAELISIDTSASV